MKTNNTQTQPNETVALIRELMEGWSKIEAAAKQQFPKASSEEFYTICKGAMNHAIGIA